MSEAVRRAVRKRDGAPAPVPPKAEAIASTPWAPRTDDRRAILVSERSAVFDRPAAIPPVAADIVTAGIETTSLGPVPTAWTPDLVHCRLVLAYTQASTLPRILWPADVRSALGQLQPQAPGALRRPLGEAELSVLDWTWTLVWRLGEDDRSIVRGFMSGASLRDIASDLKALQARGIGIGKAIGKSSVGKRYRDITGAWAKDWDRRGEPIDRNTLEVWSAAAKKQ